MRLEAIATSSKRLRHQMGAFEHSLDASGGQPPCQLSESHEQLLHLNTQFMFHINCK